MSHLNLKTNGGLQSTIEKIKLKNLKPAFEARGFLSVSMVMIMHEKYGMACSIEIRGLLPDESARATF